MRIIKWLLVICFLCISTLTVVQTILSQGKNPQDLNWIHGEWELTYDPDGSNTEWLYFNKNNRLFFIRTWDCKLIKDTFFVRNNSFNNSDVLELYVGGRQLPVHTISENKSMITNHTGAYYIKISDSIRGINSTNKCIKNEKQTYTTR